MTWLLIAISAKAQPTDINDFDNIIYIEQTEVIVGKQAKLSVQMKNLVNDIASFQFNVYLPNDINVSVDPDDDEFLLVELSDTRTTSNKHNTFEASKQTDGSVLILCASTKNYTFNGNGGEICTITIDVPKTLEPGTYDIVLKDIVMADSQAPANTYKISEVVCTLKVSSSSAINNVYVDEEQSVYYNLNGIKFSSPHQGFNIQRSGGTVRKIIVK